MKKLFSLFLILAFWVTSKAQNTSTTLVDQRTNGLVKGALTITKTGVLNLPVRDTNFVAAQPGVIVMLPADSAANDGVVYISTGLQTSPGLHWAELGSLGTPGATWGVNILGNISQQLDLQSEFSTKQNILPVGTSVQYWDATGALQNFPTIPAQLNLTTPNGSNIIINGTYPNLSISNGITNLSQLTNGPGFITSNQSIIISGDASGNGTTSISLVLASVNTSGAGTCNLCTVQFDVKGRAISYSSGSGSSPVTSVFTRTGAITAQTGDYTAAQITNALSSTGSYTNPSWLVSIPWTKITTTPTSIAGYGITDNLVNTFNTRTGTVTLTSSDVTTALTYTPVPNSLTITINGTTQSLTGNQTWTVAGTGTVNRISPIDSLGSHANGLQISGVSIVPSSATATTPGMMTAAMAAEVDSIINRTIYARIFLGHQGAGLWGGWTNAIGDSLYLRNHNSGLWVNVVAQTDSSFKYIADSASMHTYWNNYYLPIGNTITINGTTSPLSSNPSFTISGGGTSDTVTTSAAGLMSVYTYLKTLNPLVTWNDSTGTRDTVFHSDFDTLFAKTINPGFGMKNFQTQTGIYFWVDSTVMATWSHQQQSVDIINAALAGKQPTISGTGIPIFTGASIAFETFAQLTANLSLVTQSNQGLVPAPGTNTGTHFLSDLGWTTLPSFSVFTANGVSGGASTDSLYWGNSPLNQPTTITIPNANWLTFNGSLTTTANNQWYWKINPTITLEASSADVNTGITLSPGFTLGANSQVVSALDINPTMNAGSFTGGALYSLRIGADLIPLTNASVNLGGANNNFASVHTRNINSDGSIGITSTAANQIIIALGNGANGVSFLSGGTASFVGNGLFPGTLQVYTISNGSSTDSVLTEHGGLVGKSSFSQLLGATTLVNTFNGRSGTVTPASGDYTAAQVTNAVSTTGSYSAPSWLTSINYSIISGVSVNLSSQVTNILPVANGGTGQTAASLGSLLIGQSSTNFASLNGNTTTTKMFLAQTGTGSVSANPQWGVLVSGDITTGLGFTPENVANKETTLTNSTTSYPSGSAVEAYLSANYAPLTGFSLTGTGGAGYIAFPAQGGGPSLTPTSGIVMYSPSNNEFGFYGPSLKQDIFIFPTSNNYTYTFPAITDVITTAGETQTLTNKTLTSPLINFGSDAQGDVMVRGASNYGRVGVGSVNQVLGVVSANTLGYLNPGATLAYNTIISGGGIGNTTENSLYGSTGTGTLTIPASTLVTGREYHFRLSGLISLASGHTATFRMYIGSTVVCSIVLASTVNGPFVLEGSFQASGTGSTATIFADGNLTITPTNAGGGGLGTPYIANLNSFTGSPVTVTNTSALAFNLTCQMNTSTDSITTYEEDFVKVN